MGPCSALHAASYYSDPVNGSMANDGSLGSPWGNLQAIFSAGKAFSAGDEIFLMDGAHGQPYITGSHADYVTIKALAGHNPKIASVELGNGSYWAFDGLTFTADGSGGTFTRDYLFLTKSTTTYVKVENCTFHSAEDSSSWSKADWYANAEDGVRIRGEQTIFNNNLVKNTMFAVEFSGAYVEAKNNVIDNFGGDALRALASHGLYEGNLIRDAYIEDYAVNHDDGIQMYPIVNGAFDPNGVFSNMVFRNNQIYTFADPITQAMIDDDLIGYSMQSMIVTDGHIENSVVENNLIVADHSHGITLSGPVNCRVQNNTVMKTPTSVNPDSSQIPWIAFVVDKNGNQSTNSIMRNNIASKFTPWTHSGGSNILVENNLEPAANQYVNIFADYNNFDFTLKETSVAIDAGVNTDLAATDLAGNPRLSGPLVDQGAYEFQFPSPYELWIADYPGVGTATNLTDNPDNDSLNNLGEWAMGGNPDDANDVGHVPTLGTIEYFGDEWLEYVYARRTDHIDLGLAYAVEHTTNLVDGTWLPVNPVDIEVGAPGSAGPGFDSVTNWVIATGRDTQFMHLVVESD